MKADEIKVDNYYMAKIDGKPTHVLVKSADGKGRFLVLSVETNIRQVLKARAFITATIKFDAKKDKLKKIIDAWSKEICDRASQIDPNDELCWQSMFTGFAIGCGATVEEAINYDLYKEAFKKEVRF